MADPKAIELFPFYECVEWRYDGLKGSIIKWTHEHGSDHEDPSVLGWVLDSTENEIARAGRNDLYTPSGFVAFLNKWKAPLRRSSHGSRNASSAEPLPFEEANVTGDSLDGIDPAEAVLVFITQPSGEDQDRSTAKLAEKCAKYEEKVLGNPDVRELLDGVRFFRVVITDPSYAEFLERHDVKNAPGCLVFAPGGEDPLVCGNESSGRKLITALKKAAR